MKPKAILLLLCNLFALCLLAQKRNAVWPVSNYSGIDFNTSPPTVLDSTNVAATSIPYYVSSICDKAGNLLFYTDGFVTWNAAHKVIPKFQYRWPWSGFVMPLICPHPGNDDLYYLFGVSQSSYANQLQYLTINMSKPEGEIVYPQPSTLFNFFTVLSQDAAVALAGTTHCNGIDQWIISFTAAGFKSFLVTKTGVSTVPVVSPVSPSVLMASSLQMANGNIKVAANGERLIVPSAGAGEVVVFDFNNANGTVSNPIAVRIPDAEILEDVEISPDGSKLYVASYFVVNPTLKVERHFIRQYDLSAGTPVQIQASAFPVNGQGDAVICSPRVCFTINRTMQLAPDGRIYVSMRGNDEYFSTIDQPNNKGNDAFYMEGSFNTKKAGQSISYNYIRSGSYSLKENGIQIQKKTCADKPVSFSLMFNRIDSVKWDFGDPASGSQNFSTQLTPQHQYPGPGTYTAKAIIFSKCLSDTATAQVVVQAEKAVKVPAGIRDTVVCTGSTLTLDASVSNATTYKWENGLNFPKRTIDSSGTYEVVVANECSYDRRSFTVKFEKCECKVFVPTAFSPNGDGRNDAFKPAVKCFAQDYRLKVFNRYGGVVFQTTDPTKGWSGKTAQAPAPMGVYMWIMQYRDPATKALTEERGTVTLIR